GGAGCAGSCGPVVVGRLRTGAARPPPSTGHHAPRGGVHRAVQRPAGRGSSEAESTTLGDGCVGRVPDRPGARRYRQWRVGLSAGSGGGRERNLVTGKELPSTGPVPGRDGVRRM